MSSRDRAQRSVYLPRLLPLCNEHLRKGQTEQLMLSVAVVSCACLLAFSVITEFWGSELPISVITLSATCFFGFDYES